MPAKPGRRARDAVFAVRFTEVTLARPRHGRREEGPDSVALTVVDVREVAAPVRWRLLTSHAVTTVAEAFEVVELYRRRWAIEQLFRTMKSKGFDIEGLRCRLVTATLIAAITIQQLVYARDGGQGPRPLRPLSDAFSPEDQPLLEAFCVTLEGKTERQKIPTPRARSPTPPGSPPASEVGPATTGNPAPSSCSTDGSTSKPQKPVQTS